MKKFYETNTKFNNHKSPILVMNSETFEIEKEYTNFTDFYNDIKNEFENSISIGYLYKLLTKSTEERHSLLQHNIKIKNCLSAIIYNEKIFYILLLKL